jgi:hypothetical protein
MIGFINTFLYNHSESQSITTTRNQSSAEPFFLDCRGLAPFSFSFSLSLSLSLWLTYESESVRVRVTLRLTVGQSVCLSVCLSWCRASSGAHDQILITVWQLLSCPWEGALSDERTGLSFASQSAVLGQLSVKYNFYILHVSHVSEYIYKTYNTSVSPGSVQQTMPYFW